MKSWLVLLSLLFTKLTWAQVPEGVQIQYVNSKGSGCTNGSANAIIAPGGQYFTVMMDNYIAETTPSLNLDYKTCTLKIGIVAPAGWSFGLMTADYRGFVSAEPGTQVSHQVLYSFDGSKPPNEKPGYGNSPGKYSFEQKVFHGPVTDNYFIRNTIDPRASLWSPCLRGGAQPLIIQTFLIAQSKAPGRLAQITLDTVDGAIVQQFSWSWRRCGETESPGRGNQGAPTRPNPPRFRR